MTGNVPIGRIARDDLPHQLRDRPGVLENYAWYGHDPESGFGFVAHQGTMPEDPMLWHAVIYVHLPDGRQLVAKDVAPRPGPDTVGTSVHRFTCMEPFDHWRITFYGGCRLVSSDDLEGGLVRDGRSTPVQIDLELRAAGPAWDPAASEGRAEGWTDLHHEQALSMRGAVTSGGNTWHIAQGVGYRDHSVGPRDLRQLATHSWCNGAFPSGRSFGSLEVGHLDGGRTTRAYVVFDGTIEDARIVEMPAMANVRAEPETFVVRLATRDGEAHIDGSLVPNRNANFSVAGPAEWTIGTAVGSDGTYFLAQRLVRWEWDGEIGYGMADRGGLLGLFEH
jgi:hypothetical protein